MTTREDLKKAVFEAMDRVNEVLPPGHELDKLEDTVLVGPGGKLDSLGWVNFSVAVEEALESNLGLQLSLTGTGNGSGESRFNTVGQLVDHIYLVANDSH